MTHRVLIDPFVEVVMADEFVLQRLECVCGILGVTPMDTTPVDEIRPANTALPASLRSHPFCGP